MPLLLQDISSPCVQFGRDTWPFKEDVVKLKKMKHRWSGGSAMSDQKKCLQWNLGTDCNQIPLADVYMLPWV